MLSSQTTRAITIPFLPPDIPSEYLIDGKILTPEEIIANQKLQEKVGALKAKAGKCSKPNKEHYSTILSPHHLFGISSVIGSGGMGKVRYVQDQATNKWSALKIMKNSHEAKKEFQMLQQVKEIEDTSDPVFFTRTSKKHQIKKSYFLMKLKRGICLVDLLNYKLNSIIVCKIAINLIKACEKLQAQNVFHGDIKPDNIMVDPATGDVELIDFGISMIIQDNGIIPHDTKIGGTPKYVAPEIWHKICQSNGHHNFEFKQLKYFIDMLIQHSILPKNYIETPVPIFSAEKMTMYSIGMTLSTLFQFTSVRDLDILPKKWQLSPSKSITAKIESLFDLTKSMLSAHPDQRPSYIEAKNTLTIILEQIINEKCPLRVGVLIANAELDATQQYDLLYLCVHVDDINDEEAVKLYLADRKKELENAGYIVSNIAYVYRSADELSVAIKDHYLDVKDCIKLLDAQKIIKPTKEAKPLPEQSTHMRPRACSM